jgi:hypothetical protein
MNNQRIRFQMRMPFGKYKGLMVEEVPIEYLHWLWSNVSLFDPLKSEVHFQIYGFDLPTANTVNDIPENDEISRIYKQLAMKWHPDRGGTKEAMQAINEFREMLKDVKCT